MRSAAIHSLLVAVVGVLAGCFNQNSPVVQAPDSGPPAYTTAFADSVLTISQGGAVTDCTAGLPDCVSSKTQTGSCASNAALGANDLPAGAPFFNLNANDAIILGFQCSVVLALGMPGAADASASNDFRVFAEPDPNSFPVVEVSLDAVNFVALNAWAGLNEGAPTNDPFFQLDASNLSQIRYVRISNTGSGVVKLDAVEALRAVVQ